MGVGGHVTGMGMISCPDANLGDVRRLQMSLKQQPDGPVDQLVLFLWLHNKNTAQRHGPGPGHARDKLSIYTRNEILRNAALLVGATTITLVCTSEGLCFLMSSTTS